MFFEASISGNTSTMRVIFFCKGLNFNVEFENGKKKKKTFQKKFFVFEKIASELVALNCLY